MQMSDKDFEKALEKRMRMKRNEGDGGKDMMEWALVGAWTVFLLILMRELTMLRINECRRFKAQRMLDLTKLSEVELENMLQIQL